MSLIIIIIITVAGVIEYVNVDESWFLVDFFVILVINGIWLMLK